MSLHLVGISPAIALMQEGRFVSLTFSKCIPFDMTESQFSLASRKWKFTRLDLRFLLIWTEFAQACHC